jgi:hypothetical protein
VLPKANGHAKCVFFVNINMTSNSNSMLCRKQRGRAKRRKFQESDNEDESDDASEETEEADASSDGGAEPQASQEVSDEEKEEQNKGDERPSRSARTRAQVWIIGLSLAHD